MTRDFYVRKIFPLGLLMASTLGFGNLAYLYLSVSFIQILKAMTPVMTMVVLVAARLDKPSTPVTIAVSIIALGTAIASWGELAFSLLGFVVMILSEACEACKLAAMQYLLGNLKLQLMEGIYYFTPAGFFWMVLFIVPLELARMREEGAADIVMANKGAFLLAASLGFCVNLLSFGVIQSTSGLTYKVLGQVKNVAVVLSSVVLFGSAVSGLQSFGYAISIVGFGLYNKAQQARATAAPTAAELKAGGEGDGEEAGAKDGAAGNGGSNGGGGLLKSRPSFLGEPGVPKLSASSALLT